MTSRSLYQPTPARMAIAAITFYQRALSPRKGWRCAHRARYGRSSCSAWIKRAIAHRGLRVGTLLARRRFARCHAAANARWEPRETEARWETEEDKKERNKESIWTRPHACWCDSLVDQSATSFGAIDCASCACDIFQLFGWFGL